MRALLPFIALAIAACEEPKQDDTGPVVAENTPPTASFVSPAEGAALRVGDPLSLTALVGDAETAVEDLVVTWTSSRDGVLAGTATVAAGVASLALATELSAGDQTLSVIVADEEGLSASDQVTITVQDNATPNVSFTTPAPEAVFAEGADVTVSVSGSDDHDDPSDITLAWGGDAADLGAPTGLTASGTATFFIQDIAAGTWLLSVTATDSEGADATEQVLFTVIADADQDGDGYGDAGDSALACTQPAGTAEVGTDCDDTTASVNPSASELCDGLDNDCDGTVDEASAIDASTWYRDSDSDGYGLTTAPMMACTAPSGYAAADGDCDDSSAATHPSAAEACDGVDNDCDGSVDEGATDFGTFYADADDDGYGDAAASTTACTAPSGYVTDTTDCDDGDATIFPGAGERCDGQDNDCDGYTDEGAYDATTWYLDLDGDGYGGSTTTSSCDPPTSYVALGGDCNDSSTAMNPGASEVCDGYDNDCDGSVDEEIPTWYRDADGDGYGNPAVSTTTCTPPSSYVADDDDCDDGDPTISPAATEVCFDGVDNDCDGSIDGPDAVDTLTWYADADDDGYGDSTSTTAACTVPSGYVADDTDCDDSDDTVNPDALEICDGIDNDCDGAIEDAILVPGDHATIAAAIAAAVDGDTICVGEGDYTGPLDYNGKDITIEGAGSDLTFIDVNGGRVTFDAGETAAAQLIGVTLWGGNQSYGAALLCSSASPTLQDVVFDSNTCTSVSSCQGMAWFSSCHASLTDVAFIDNSASISGTVYGVAMYVNNSNLTVEGLTLDGNTVAATSVQGGLIHMTDSDGTWEDVQVTDNTITTTSPFYGGLLYIYNNSDPDFTHLYAADNTVTSTGSTYDNLYPSPTSPFYNYTSPWGSSGDINVDPLYVDMTAASGVYWDLTLQSTSPVRNAGNPSSAYFDTDGTYSAIGAYGGPLGDGW